MDADSIIKALTDPKIYPHLCGEVQVLETHISWVFLTGEFAYKVKKPVDYGFLDFSTLSKRRFYCEQELQRNKVFAPDIYLEVLGLHSMDGSFFLAEVLDGAKEYLVKMRQFSQQELLSNQVAAFSFTEENAHQLGVQLGQLHQQLQQAPNDSQWGAPEAIGYPIKENFTQILPLLSHEEDIQKLKAIEQWSLKALTADQALFITRKQQGFIRACHGDLHLNNLLWQNGNAVPFDCIEFNDEFHWIDVISELAFLLMDLEHQKCFELANQCLNGYLETTGDYEAVPLLRFYKTYRAMVRAKVAILRQQQPGLADGEKQKLQDEYHAYIALAERYIKPTQPCLYITHGVSGSGKTTMARFVAGRLEAIHIRSDVERKRLFGLAANESSSSMLNSGIYSPEATAKTFQRLEDIATLLVQKGASVIVDATFLKQATRNQFRDLAKRLKVPYAILDCAIDEQTARNRVQARVQEGQDASEADLKVLEKQLSEQDFLSPQEQHHVVVIDMGKPLEDIELEKLIRCECIAD